MTEKHKPERNHQIDGHTTGFRVYKEKYHQFVIRKTSISSIYCLLNSIQIDTKSVRWKRLNSKIYGI